MYYTCNARGNAKNAIVHPELVPGTVMYSEWGYDQTNIDYYIVDRRTPTMAVLLPLASTEVADAGFMSYYVVPDESRVRGSPVRCKVLDYEGEPYCTVGYRQYAYVWDGEPKMESHYA